MTGIEKQAVELLDKTRICPSDICRELLTLDYELSKIKFLNDSNFINIVPHLTYRVMKYVYDECEFYNTTQETQKIWDIIDKWHSRTCHMSEKQMKFIYSIVNAGVRRYAREFKEKFYRFVEKIKAEGIK